MTSYCSILRYVRVHIAYTLFSFKTKKKLLSVFYFCLKLFHLLAKEMKAVIKPGRIIGSTRNANYGIFSNTVTK